MAPPGRAPDGVRHVRRLRRRTSDSPDAVNQLKLPTKYRILFYTHCLLDPDGCCCAGLRSSDCPVKQDSADWTPNGKSGGSADRSAGKSLPFHSAPACSCRGLDVSPNPAGGHIRVQGKLCAVRCGRVMANLVIVWVVAACPVNPYVVLALVVHTLRKRFTTRRSVDVLAHAPFTGAPPVCQCAWTLQDSAGSWDVVLVLATSSKLIGPQCYSSTTAAVAVRWSWTAAPSAVNRDVSIIHPT